VTITSAFITAVGLAAPATAPAVAATESAVAVNPDRSPGNARMTDGRGKQVQALELEATLAPSIVFSEPANPSNQDSFSRWGVEGTVSFTYRARYFLQPTIIVGYAHLASGEATLPDGVFAPPGQEPITLYTGGKLEQSLGAWSVSPGVAFPFWRFRLIATIGFSIAQQSNTLNGEENSSSQLGLSSRAALSFDALKTERTRLAVELQSSNSAGLKLHWMTLGVSFRGDFVQWD
jgi:hypothetical protein